MLNVHFWLDLTDVYKIYQSLSYNYTFRNSSKFILYPMQDFSSKNISVNAVCDFGKKKNRNFKKESCASPFDYYADTKLKFD